MRIKRFTGRTLREATEQMKTELGPEAVVLHSKKVARGGALNFLGREHFEITAAVDEVSTAGNGAAAYGWREGGRGPRLTRAGGELAPKSDDAVGHLREIADRFETSRQRTPERSVVGVRPELLELRGELDEMKGTIRLMAEQLKYSRMPALPDHLQRAYAMLVDQEVEEQLAADLVQSVYAGLNRDQLADPGLTRDQLVRSVAGLFRAAPPAKPRRKRSRVIALVGPTGVGKTTTIAKLAANYKLVDRLSVALITADTYRIGAIEQLRTFAAIADVPMEVVYRASELPAVIRKFKDKEIILIDTVGRSQRSGAEIANLSKFISAADPDEIHLVLSAATGRKTALEILRRFRPVKPNRLLASKLDETAAPGGLLNVVRACQLPMSYVTTGQNVPDDIQPADPAALASMIFTGEVAHA